MTRNEWKSIAIIVGLLLTIPVSTERGYTQAGNSDWRLRKYLFIEGINEYVSHSPPHTLRVNIVKAVASFLYIVASISGGVDDAGPEQAERDDSAHRGCFLPLWVHTEAAIRLFVSVVPSWVSGSHPYAPAYWIGRKQEVDSAREGRCFTHLWPVLSCYSPCLYLIIAHAWALDT